MQKSVSFAAPFEITISKVTPTMRRQSKRAVIVEGKIESKILDSAMTFTLTAYEGGNFRMDRASNSMIEALLIHTLEKWQPIVAAAAGW